MYLNEISSQGSSEVWFDCDSGKIIPGEVSQSSTATVDGSYAVIVTDSVCVDTSSCYTIMVTGISDQPDGVYFLNVVSDDKKQSVKIIKQE